jgi:two-component system cell cycle sensor histidine kinase/response regulator CckA
VVYGIVKQCAGSIWVYSELGQGTTFKIYLPRVDELVENLNSSHHLHKKLLQGQENILLVEDEESVRVFLRNVLQSYGYTVLEAAHGEEALNTANQNEGRKIHLLLTDVMMPGMNGLELAESLAHCRPEIKVLYMSGYTNAVTTHNDMAESGIPFLQKPFSPDALACKVREVLAR